jgi:hypothetical protein
MIGRNVQQHGIGLRSLPDERKFRLLADARRQALTVVNFAAPASAGAEDGGHTLNGQ